MSNYKLCIDWGNSFVKIALIDRNDKIEEQYKLEPDAVLDILERHICPRRNFSGVIICDVTGNHIQVLDFLNTLTDKIILLNSKTPLPILNAYSTTEKLGADRIALVCGAYAQNANKNNLVICVGTCITYNFIGTNRAFRGGLISPGVKMRLDSMHHFTAKLPEVSLDGDTLLLGYDTESCMRGGAVLGAAAEIDGIIALYENQYPDFNAILTGGDMTLLANKIKNKIFADPDLLFKGLNLILKHNVPQAN
jgi:type III pantothenate kinase